MLYGGLQGLISPVFKNFSRVAGIPFGVSCLRRYRFRLGVPVSLFNGICIGLVFLVFPGVPSAHTSGFTCL